MRSPPHYQSFRIVLVLVLLGALVSGVWWVVQLELLGAILRFLGVQP
ncbi:MAG: hypothetical protein ACRDS9_04770 [Pseudonocardiaceae bacterium]